MTTDSTAGRTADSSDVGAELAELRARVEHLEAERAIQRTLYRYGHAIDYGDEPTWVGLFLPDATYELRYRLDGGENGGEGARVRLFQGHDEIAGFVAGHTRAPSFFHKHVLVEPMITVDGDRATAVSYFERLDEIDGDRRIKAFGRYLDDLERCPDGRWRFRRRLAEIESYDPRPRVSE